MAIEGKGVVLIDELDLHLHPKWQRTVVDNLCRTFPQCQFIATTHSPQIIPSLEPERIQFIKDDEVLRPDRSLGLDSNWILNHLMDASERPLGASEAIKHVESLISEGDYNNARIAINGYKDKRALDLPEWAVLEARIARLEIFDDKK